MKISKMFYAVLACGLCLGVGFMMIILSTIDADTREVIGAGLILFSIGLAALLIIKQKLELEWDSTIAVNHLIKDWWEEHVEAPFPHDDEIVDCFTCNITCHKECPLFEKED